ncbi:DoxX family protein [Streptomyces tibetensis]|uniref:DoxX family protein n=1 Tax=Streptomyces tibetensis TaxID=2382123 RepID=UPI0033CE3526
MSEITAAVPTGSTSTDSARTGSTPTGVVIAESATARGRRARIALRAVQVLLALFYAIASALPKLIGHESAAESFERLGWGSAGMYTIGALELAGAIALLIPMLQSVAAMALGALMVGAFIVQTTVFDGQYAATPVILLLPLTLIAWARRRHTADLLRLLRRR